MHAIEKEFYVKVIIQNISVSSTDSFFLYRRRYLFQMYILVLENCFQIVVSVLHGLLHLFVDFHF